MWVAPKYLSPDQLFLLWFGTQLACGAHSNLKPKRSNTELVLFTPDPLLASSLWEGYHRPSIHLPHPGDLASSLSLPCPTPTTALPSVSTVVSHSTIAWILYVFRCHHCHRPHLPAACSNLTALPCGDSCSCQSILSQAARANFLKCKSGHVTPLHKALQCLLLLLG